MFHVKPSLVVVPVLVSVDVESDGSTRAHGH